MTDIIATITQHTQPSMIRRLAYAGVGVFRLNLSHVDTMPEVERVFRTIEDETDGDEVKLLIDSHGTVDARHKFTQFEYHLLVNPWFLVDYFAVSFVHGVEAVNAGRELVKQAKLVAKIEDPVGLMARVPIADSADVVMVDRHDMRKHGVTNIPKACREIVEVTNAALKPMWVASDVLASMVYRPYPSAAELDSIYALEDAGVTGFVLTDETARGKYPLHCVELLKKITEA